MSTFNYVFTKPANSGERLALIKVDQILALLVDLLEKLDSDTGVSDNDYSDLIANIKTAREKLGCDLNDLQEQE